MIHDLKVTKDTRASFLIESFGFGVSGVQNITTTSPFTVASDVVAVPSKFCFIIKITPSDNSEYMDETMRLKCSAPEKNDVLIPVDWKGGNPDVRRIRGTLACYLGVSFDKKTNIPQKNHLAFPICIL
jgi:hypothetical protein